MHFNAMEELYDMHNDPHELNNLVSLSDYKSRLIHLRELADQWCKENNHDTILNENRELIRINPPLLSLYRGGIIRHLELNVNH